MTGQMKGMHEAMGILDGGAPPHRAQWHPQAEPTFSFCRASGEEEEAKVQAGEDVPEGTVRFQRGDSPGGGG